MRFEFELGVLGHVYFEVYSPVSPGGIARGEEHFAPRIPVGLGGALNTARVAQDLGAAVKLFYPSGHGLLDELVTRSLTDQKLPFETFHAKDNPALSVVFPFEDGERGFLSHADHESFRHIRTAFPCRWIHAAGFKEAFFARHILSAAQNLGSRISVSASWAPEELKSLREKDALPWNLLFLNEKEAALAFGDTQAAIEQCRRWGRDMVITRGQKGAIACIDDERFDCPAVAGIDVVDSTGAGDALAAGVLVGLIRGLEKKNALELGVKAAAQIIQQVSGVPRHIDALRALGKEYGTTAEL